MAFLWKKPRASRLAAKKLLSKQNSQLELIIPTHFRCPISLDLMKDPVTLSTGITYDRVSIEKWMLDGNQTCPVTNQVLDSFDLIPNHSLRRMIQDWCVENRAHGIERIPTPRTPITSSDVADVCSKIMASAQREDGKRCQELVEKITVWANESERNKNLIKDNGIGYVLSASFESFSSFSFKKYEELLKQILFLLTWMFPLGIEGQAKLGSTPSLRSMARFLQGDDLPSKKNAVYVLKELLSSDQKHVKSLINIEGLPEALVKIVKVPSCSSATKSSLSVIYYIVSTPNASEKISLRFLELDLVELCLELLVESEKGISEMALGILDGISRSKEGKERVRNNALTVPLLVKKILRVSPLATDFCVSILWKLGEKDDNGSVLVEALHVGAFQKLLLMLQVNCGEGTKVKATEMLKLMNHYKNKLDCFDSGHYKYLRKSY